MSVPTALTWANSQHWTCLIPRSGSREVCRICLASNLDMFRYLTPQQLDSLRGAIKGAPRSLTHLDILLTCKHFEPKLPELKLSPPQASLKFELSKRYLSHPLEYPSQSSSNHFTDNLCVFVTLGNLSSRRTRCPPGATKVVVSLRKFVLPSPSWGFDSGKPN
jgi:hypothetical protein